ncbi:MAG: peptide-methionine (S)-S-oxide reductase MsrA [Pseudomonadota bacterium]
MFFSFKKSEMIPPERALAGRPDAIPTAERHFVNNNPLMGPYPDGAETAVVAMGCFWGAERVFWRQPGVFVTMVGYAGGYTPNPTYREVCSGQTGHTEVVGIVYEPEKIGFEEVLRLFWESHDPTQGMRQGNDLGTQYRSAIYTTTPEQMAIATASRDTFQEALTRRGFGTITTEIAEAGEFYFAEEYHQQYLAKNPGGYCGLGGTGVTCPGTVEERSTSA